MNNADKFVDQLAEDATAIPGDLPEHSLHTYNPNRTRFSPTRTNPTVGLGAEDLENTLEPERQQSEQIPSSQVPVRPALPEEPRHKMLRLIGRGGCGEVWEAIQVELDRPVAVKTLREDLLRAQSSEQTRDDLVRNFREEALIAARLDHPNIVPVYDYGRGEDGSPELSMKLVRGEPWDRLLKTERNALSVDDYLARHVAILSAVANAVAFAHSRNIVHRDIKPSQVMVGEFGEVLLMDWGLALVVGDDGTMASKAAERPQWFSLPTVATASSPAGTPAYMAPEQTRGTARYVGPWTDIYLLGGCLYCILAGHAPHVATASQEAFLKAVRSEVPDPRTIQPAGVVPDDLAELAMRALSPAPQDRVASADDFVRILEDWISGASRRRESQKLTAQLLAEVDRPRTTYSAHVAFIDRIQRAAGLWPGNPEVPELRANAIEDYAELALEKGDLLLALSQADLLPPSEKLTVLERRIEAAKQQRQRARRNLRIAVGSVIALVALVIVGGVVSLRSIESERDEAVTQKNTATRALSEAEVARREAEAARERANNEQIYAQIRSATSLIEAGRHEMARAVLWSVPEDARSWEWAYLIDRCHQAMAEFPFAASAVSKGGTWFFVSDGDGRVEVRDTMAGALVATLAVGATAPQISPPTEDTHVDILAENVLLRFAPPEWEPHVLAELPDTPKLFLRTLVGGNFAIAYADGSGAYHEGTTGALRFRTGPQPQPLIGIDADDEAERFLIAYKSHFQVHRTTDGTLEYSIATGLRDPHSPGLTNKGHSVAMIEGRHSHFFNLETGRITDCFADGTQLATFPSNREALQMPVLVDTVSGLQRHFIPVGRSTEAKAYFMHDLLVCFWGGPNGEAGVMNTADNHVSAELRGAPGNIRNLWASLSKTHIGPDRVFTVTDDGSSQVWLGTPHKAIAELPGQWASFRQQGRRAVSIASFDARITDLDSGGSLLRVGTMFRITRGIHIAEELDRVFTFGYGYFTDQYFGWEVSKHSTGEVLRSVKVGTEKEALPYLWSTGGDNRRALVYWKQDQPGVLLATEDGATIATIPTTSAPPTALRFTDEATILVGDNAGTIVELNAEDGRELRRIETGAPVWTMNAPADQRLLYVSGGDRRLRTYRYDGTARTLVSERSTGSDPATVIDFSEDGARVLALTRANEVVVFKEPDGTEVLRFKIDSELHRIQMNAEGTRIFGLGPAGLRVWDLKGREVAQVPDVLDISLKTRRMILRTQMSRIGRDIVVEMPPYRADEYPGDGTMDFRERFQLWRREQHRKWWERQAVQLAPQSIAIAQSSATGTVGEGRDRLLSDLSGALIDLRYLARANTTAAPELLRKLGALYSFPPEGRWEHFPNDLWDPVAALRKEHARLLLNDTKPYSELRFISGARDRKDVLFEGEHWMPMFVATALEALGHSKEAQAVALRGTLTERAMRREQMMGIERLRERILRGVAVPPIPPEFMGDGPNVQNTPYFREELNRLPLDTMTTAEIDAARKDIAAKWEAKFRAWLDEVAPYPDFDALLEKVRATLPPPPPADMPLAEFMGDVLERLEREQLGGLTREEARAAARKRFDDSVAAAEAEQEAAGK